MAGGEMGEQRKPVSFHLTGRHIQLTGVGPATTLRAEAARRACLSLVCFLIGV